MTMIYESFDFNSVLDTQPIITTIEERQEGLEQEA
jgi:hypothetical protein